MRFTDPTNAPRGGASEHRPGGIAFTYLLSGSDFAPDNYSLMLVHVADAFHTPRHRHNFEQVRVMLDGHFGFGPGHSQGPGSVGYFCEGTAYTQSAQGASTTLLLQVGGASGHGYMSAAQLQQGVATLKQRGSFEDGVYSWLDAAGKRHKQDGYEAVWEHTFGRTINYPQPRYEAPVILWPQRFGWLDCQQQPAVQTQHLGSFNERGLSLRGWRLVAGARAPLRAADQRTLAYVQAGEGLCVGTGSDATPANSQTLRPGFAFELLRGEQVVLQAGGAPLQLLLFGLPVFEA
jgi:hypothetical protein